MARDWNTNDAASAFTGYVLRFDVQADFLDRYEIHTLGDSRHQEYWIPTADLAEFNQDIVGKIEISAQKSVKLARNPICRPTVLMWNLLWNILHSVEVVQIVLEKRLLRATDKAAQRTKRNRSALVRDALREHLRALELREKEERDRRGYERNPKTREESIWEREAAWPPE